VLGGEWFTDEIRALGHRDTSMSLAGKWIIEFSELEAFNGESVETLKSFLTRRVDRFRPPYGRSVIDVQRHCLFAGNTKNPENLSDSSGNRRFWPVTVGMADLEALERDRDQLWAEAAVLVAAAGEVHWWLETAELRSAADAVAESFTEIDPWEELIAE